MIKINCIWNNQGAWCKNREIKRSLFGLGARCCVEYDGNKTCQLKELRPKPIKPSPHPFKRNNPKIIIINLRRKNGKKEKDKKDENFC